MSHKPIVFIDMDGVLVDLDTNIRQKRAKNCEFSAISGDLIQGIYRDAQPMPGAVDAIQRLVDSNKYELYIATTVPSKHPQAAADKMWWLYDHFGDLFAKRMFFTHRKDMLQGDILIDDRQHNFKGIHLHFGTLKYPDWSSVLEYLL